MSSLNTFSVSLSSEKQNLTLRNEKRREEDNKKKKKRTHMEIDIRPCLLFCSR